MGKNSGGVTDWHKQQHKKQLTRNKEARISARDERVVQEKTVQDIRADIRKIEHHHKNEQQRPHAIQSKLDRLNKELKLVTAKEEADKERREQKVQQQNDAQKYETKNIFIPLARPEVSIYYDSVMNPFGAPPPGQPSLYYRRGGGTTNKLDESCSPQEQFLPPPPPPPPPPRKVQSSDQHRPNHRSNIQQNPYRPSNDSKNKNISENNEAKLSNDTQSMVNTKVLIDPTHLPDLPKPSFAVARSKRNKLTADIWASTDEIQYEETVSSIGLQDTTSTVSTQTQWYYKDVSGTIQGPYTTDQMKIWNQAGYFPITTLVSVSSGSDPWKPIKEMKQLKIQNSVKMSLIDHDLSNNESSSVQDRIAALRNDRTRSSNEDEPDSSDSEVEGSVQRRIASLKATSQQNNFVAQNSIDDDDSKVQKLIAALKDERNYNTTTKPISLETVTLQNQGEFHHLKVDNTAGEGSNNPTERRFIDKNPLPAPPSPPAPPGKNKNEVLREIALSYSLDDHVVPYPIDDEATSIEVACTTVEEQNRYDCDADNGHDADIPVTGDYDYGIHENFVGDIPEYLATGPYDNGSDECDSIEVEQLKKRIKVDSDVVALIPSRVRKR